MIGNGFPGTSGQSLPDSSVPSIILPNANVGSTVIGNANLPGVGNAPNGTGEIIYNSEYCIIKFVPSQELSASLSLYIWCGNGTTIEQFGCLYSSAGIETRYVGCGANNFVKKSYLVIKSGNGILYAGQTYYIVCPTILYVYSG